MAASDLLKQPKVREYLEQLHREAREGALSELRPWLDLAGEAQAVVMATLRGQLRSRMCLDAAQIVLDRAFGKPTERREIEVRDHARTLRALQAFGMRLREEGR